MTTYPIASLSDAVIAYQKPITLQQGRGFRDLTLSVAEADATVPANLLPTVHLGTLTTTSGTSQTLSSLVLTPYKSLRITLEGVSFTATGPQLRLGGVGQEITATLGTAGFGFYGTVLLDLANGVATSITAELNAGASGVGAIRITDTGYSTATTSITFDGSGGGTFDAGSIRVYGEK